MTVIDDIKTRQQSYFQSNGKYEKFDYQGLKIDEYVGPQGPGYIVYQFKTENDTDYIKADDYGLEGRSFDWKEYGKGT